LLSLISNSSTAQAGVNDTIKTFGWITPQGDTIAMSYLPMVEVEAKRFLTNYEKQQRAEWTRLRNAVYVTFPYAKAASKIMNEINAQLVNVTDKSKRRAIIKSREKDLRRDFTSKLTNLSVYQGKVLMKLINRETGNNCYEIIKEYKGLFTVALYQTVALIFGSNLRQDYNPKEKDAAIEIIVKEVEKMYGYKS
jgi:Domain of unknown function (DUF4294)